MGNENFLFTAKEIGKHWFEDHKEATPEDKDLVLNQKLMKQSNYIRCEDVFKKSVVQRQDYDCCFICRRAHNLYTYYCSQCEPNQIFICVKSFKDHCARKKHDDIGFGCIGCNHKTNSASGIRHHLKKCEKYKTNKNICCYTCKKMGNESFLFSGQELGKHWWKDHKEAAPKNKDLVLNQDCNTDMFNEYSTTESDSDVEKICPAEENSHEAVQDIDYLMSDLTVPVEDNNQVDMQLGTSSEHMRNNIVLNQNNQNYGKQVICNAVQIKECPIILVDESNNELPKVSQNQDKNNLMVALMKFLDRVENNN